MKWVEIKRLTGESIVCGLMSQSTYMHFIRENCGTSFDDDANTIWRKAEPHSLYEYLYNLKVRVREHIH